MQKQTPIKPNLNIGIDIALPSEGSPVFYERLRQERLFVFSILAEYLRQTIFEGVRMRIVLKL